MTLETGLDLAKARRLLAEAEGMLTTLHYNEAAGRTAYLAGFQAAQALRSDKTGRAANSHNGVRTEFHRLIRGDARFDDTLREFPGSTYNLKALPTMKPDRILTSHRKGQSGPLRKPDYLLPKCSLSLRA